MAKQIDKEEFAELNGVTIQESILEDNEKLSLKLTDGRTFYILVGSSTETLGEFTPFLYLERG